ncbi:hypothetical protein ABZX12_26230 [Kribbella sp. NPDC003505]|uniref:hypothetical protein n=1 Tax=Kribbella sp. NPDC003505 TaxID=3154448 RepID=UPI0033BFB03A
MTESTRHRRWPAYLMAVLLLGYAVGKAVFAMRSRPGFPSGPPAEGHSFVLSTVTTQWLAAATATIGAGLCVVSAMEVGLKAPRRLMLPALVLLTLSVGAGAAIVVIDGFIGLGLGWHWYHGAVGLVAIGLITAMFRSYLTATRRYVVR